MVKSLEELIIKKGGINNIKIKAFCSDEHMFMISGKMYSLKKPYDLSIFRYNKDGSIIIVNKEDFLAKLKEPKELNFIQKQSLAQHLRINN